MLRLRSNKIEVETALFTNYYHWLRNLFFIKELIVIRYFMFALAVRENSNGRAMSATSGLGRGLNL